MHEGQVTHHAANQLFEEEHANSVQNRATELWTLTSPFLTVIDWRRGVVSSLMLERKFWEIRKASCRSGWSGWLVGVCLSRSWSTGVDRYIFISTNVQVKEHIMRYMYMYAHRHATKKLLHNTYYYLSFKYAPFFPLSALWCMSSSVIFIL